MEATLSLTFQSSVLGFDSSSVAVSCSDIMKFSFFRQVEEETLCSPADSGEMPTAELGGGGDGGLGGRQCPPSEHHIT